jgi:hypothetical protein
VAAVEGLASATSAFLTSSKLWCSSSRPQRLRLPAASPFCACLLHLARLLGLGATRGCRLGLWQFSLSCLPEPLAERRICCRQPEPASLFSRQEGLGVSFFLSLSTISLNNNENGFLSFFSIENACNSI